MHIHIVHHNPCFNLFMLHNNQGSIIKSNNCLLRKLPSYYQKKYCYLRTTKKFFLKDNKSKRKKNV